MKKLFFLISGIAAMLAVSGCTDEALTERVSDLENRMDAVEAKLDSQAKEIKTLMDAFNNGVVVTSVKEVSGGVEITLSNNEKFLVKNGEKGEKGEKGETGAQGPAGEAGAPGTPGTPGAPGQDGVTPTVTLELGSDGNYYWIINGVNTGVRANGVDGQDGAPGKDGKDGEDGAPGEAAAPSFKVENNHIYYSFDEGKTWTDAGEITVSVDAGPIASVTYTDDEVTFVLSSGATITLPLDASGELTLVLSSLKVLTQGSAASVSYEVLNGSDETVVLAYTYDRNLTILGISVDANDPNKGTVTVMGNTGKFIVEAIDNAKDGNNSTKKVVTLEAGVFSLDSDENVEIPFEGAQLTVTYTTNMDCEFACSDWIHESVTKAATERTATFTVDANESESSRNGYIQISYNGYQQGVVRITQAGKPVAKFALNDIVGTFAGTVLVRLFNGSAYQPYPGVDFSITVELSDNPSSGNVKITSVNGASVSMYTNFDIYTGVLLLPAGISFTCDGGTVTFDDDVAITLGDDLMSLSSEEALVAPHAVPIFSYYASFNLVRQFVSTGFSIDDFVGTYTGGVSEAMTMNGNTLGTQDRTSTPAAFIFEAATNGDNNVVMKKYYGNDCEVPGFFDAESGIATFSTGTVTVVQGTGTISTPLVLKLAEDCGSLTQDGTFAVQPSGMPFLWIGTLTVLTKSNVGPEPETPFVLSDIIGKSWNVSCSIDDVTYTGVMTFETTGAPGCNVYINNIFGVADSAHGGYPSSAYGFFDIETGELWLSTTFQIVLPTSLSGITGGLDNGLKLSEDKTYFEVLNGGFIIGPDYINVDDYTAELAN